MAIVIPSKNIYSINFDPVIDNQIDKVEVETVAVESDNHYNEAVYNEQFSRDIISLLNDTYNLGHTYVYSLTSAVEGAGIIVDKITSISTKIFIPFNKDISHIIDKINIDITENGNSQINYSVSGKILKGTVTVTYSGHDEGYSGGKPNPLDYSTTLTNPIYKEPATITNSNWSFGGSTKLETINKNASVSVTFEEKNMVVGKNYTTATINGKNYFVLNLQNILSSFRVARFTLDIPAPSFGSYVPKDIVQTVTGEYEEYVPETVAITIYGNIIGVNPQDKTVTIGNGYKVFSFDGNELIQTTNTINTLSSVPIEIKKGDLIRPGGINSLYSFYYDKNISINNGAILKYEKEELIVSMTSNGEGQLLVPTNGEFASLSMGVKVKVFLQQTGNQAILVQYLKTIDKWKNGKQTAIIACPIADFYDTNGNKVIDTSTSTKMLFDIGDIVIPYNYTNQGDKPIAYNKDFMPKQFKVVGTNISKKQGVQQVLTVQEV